MYVFPSILNTVCNIFSVGRRSFSVWLRRGPERSDTVNGTATSGRHWTEHRRWWGKQRRRNQGKFAGSFGVKWIIHPQPVPYHFYTPSTCPISLLCTLNLSHITSMYPQPVPYHFYTPSTCPISLLLYIYVHTPYRIPLIISILPSLITNHGSSSLEL